MTIRTRTLSQKDKFQVAYRDDFTCQFCGDKPGNSNIEIEHLIPVSKYGSDNPENLIAACRKCNQNKSDLVAFPHSMCEGNCSVDPGWIVHKSFGGWRIVFHPHHGAVLEYTLYGYWIDAGRSHDADWVPHIKSKRWPDPHKDSDFIAALAYFRLLTTK